MPYNVKYNMVWLFWGPILVITLVTGLSFIWISKTPDSKEEEHVMDATNQQEQTSGENESD